MPFNFQQALRRFRVPEKHAARYMHQKALKDFQEMDLILGGGPAPVALLFTMQRQLLSNWCWTATATSVSIFYNSASPWTQCSLAGASLDQPCCDNSSPCNIPWYLDRALEKTGNFIRYQGPLSFDEIRLQLLDERVIGCRVQWRDQKGHFLVIYGCRSDDTGQYISVDDPISGKSELTYEGFRTAYQGSGVWTHAFITKR